MPKLFNNGTNKQGLIVYGGEASVDYGIVVDEAPAFEKPVRKNTTYHVPGRNGAIIYQEDAYEDVTREYYIWVNKSTEQTLPDTVRSVSSWLYSKTGYQRLEDSFEPDVFRLAYFNGGQAFSNELMQYGRTTLSFVCRPERFLKDGEIEQTITNGSNIYNPTRYDSKPLIHIEGAGQITVLINGKTIVANVTDFINIDCDRMNAYRLPAENMNNRISGEFPTIGYGKNTVVTTGNITNMTIIPRYFSI